MPATKKAPGECHHIWIWMHIGPSQSQNYCKNIFLTVRVSACRPSGTATPALGYATHVLRVMLFRRTFVAISTWKTGTCYCKYLCFFLIHFNNCFIQNVPRPRFFSQVISAGPCFGSGSRVQGHSDANLFPTTVCSTPSYVHRKVFESLNALSKITMAELSTQAAKICTVHVSSKYMNCKTLHTALQEEL